MKTRSLLILLIFFFWGAGSTYWYVCKIKGFCAQPAISQKQNAESTIVEQTKTPKENKKSGFWAYFTKNSVQPVIQDSLQWTAVVNSWKKNKPEGKKLLIEGPYYKNENNPTDYSNIGKARAEQIKNMLAAQLDTSWVMTQGKLLSADSIPDFIDAIDHHWRWITFNNHVKQLNNKTLIYFPYNSTKEIKDQDVLNYLDDLSKMLKENPNVHVKIIGHTDNTGSHASNQILGLKRAKRIQRVLVNKGVNNKQLIVKSKGETQPIADNSTQTGKQKNRRVEIIIIK